MPSLPQRHLPSILRRQPTWLASVVVAAYSALSLATSIQSMAAEPLPLAPPATPQPDPGQRRDQSKEYKVKGALLYNFAKHATWPKDTFKSKTDPIVILVVGDDPFGKSLDQALAKKTVKGRPFKIVRSKKTRDPLEAHLVFAHGLKTKARKSLIDSSRKKVNAHVVLVGDKAEFAEAGGTIGFYIDRGKVRFAVNADRHDECPTKLSAELLKLARVVRTKKGVEQ